MLELEIHCGIYTYELSISPRKHVDNLKYHKIVITT